MMVSCIIKISRLKLGNKAIMRRRELAKIKREKDGEF